MRTIRSIISAAALLPFMIVALLTYAFTVEAQSPTATITCNAVYSSGSGTTITLNDSWSVSLNSTNSPLLQPLVANTTDQVFYATPNWITNGVVRVQNDLPLGNTNLVYCGNDGTNYLPAVAGGEASSFRAHPGANWAGGLHYKSDSNGVPFHVAWAPN